MTTIHNENNVLLLYEHSYLIVKHTHAKSDETEVLFSIASIVIYKRSVNIQSL